MKRVVRRGVNRFQFALERFIARGAVNLLLLAAGAIVLVALVAGTAAWAGTAQFTTWTEAVWWAFLRLSDPGYLGDDQGLYLRTISTAVTVLGYVLFMGALVAVMTQALNNFFRRLETGLTPIALEDHVLVLGWTSRTAAIVDELMRSTERVRRFLRRHGAAELKVVVLSENAGHAQQRFLRDRLGDAYDPDSVLVRQGTALRIESLRRVDFLHAAAIVIPAPDRVGEGSASPDGRALKTLMSTAVATRELAAEELPLVVAELFDATKVPLARKAYNGPIEILASDAFIARIIAQTLRHPGLSAITNELLSHAEGNEIYVRPVEGLVGRSPQACYAAFTQAIPLGLVRADGLSYETWLNPDPHIRLQPEDRILLMSPRLEATEPLPDALAEPPVPEPDVEDREPRSRRVLVLGWNHRVPDLIEELDSYQDEHIEIVLFNRVPVPEREAAIRRQHGQLRRVGVEQIHADHTVLAELSAVAPSGFDSVVIMASDRLQSDADADARTLLGFLVLDSLLADAERRPDVVVELMDPASVELVPPGSAELVVTSTIVSHMLTQVALRRELRAAFDQLYGPGSAEISFHPVARYGLLDGPRGFVDAQAAAARRGRIALGFRRGGTIELNPPRDERWDFEPDDELVVLTDPGDA